MQKINKDWEKFYKNNSVTNEPSDFAKFIFGKDIPGKTLIDLGAGNCRDSLLFTKKYEVMAVEPAFDQDGFNKDLIPYNLSILLSPWQEVSKYIASADIVYSRFFLHAISDQEISKIIKLSKDYFIAEARAVGDTPVIYPEHYRNYISTDSIMELMKNDFEILDFEVGRGLAKYLNEDPLVMRVIAKKNKR